MENLPKSLLIFFGILFVYHVFVSLYMSREIMVWVPNLKRKVRLLLWVWLVPFIGLRLANREAKLGFFEQRKQSDSGQTVSMGLLDIESIFNPGAKHQVEAVQEQKVQVAKKNGQLDDESETPDSSQDSK